MTARASGGTLGYTYSTNGTIFQASATFNNVVAGSYTVTAKDNNRCPARKTIVISEPTVLVADASAGSILCNGGVTTLTASASGGTLGYTYSTNGTIFQASATFNNVVAGSYTVTAKDNNGCLASKTIVISEPTVLVADASAGSILCNGGVDRKSTRLNSS